MTQGNDQRTANMENRNQTTMTSAANPCRRQQQQPLANENRPQDMGPQSQKRLSLGKRTHQMQSNNAGYQRPKSKEQKTLFGSKAFDPLYDCGVCKAKRLKTRAPHRPHHKLCPNNQRTKGVTSTATLQTLREEKRLTKLFTAPLAANEKGSYRHLTKENMTAMFQPRKKAAATATATATVVSVEVSSQDSEVVKSSPDFTPDDLYRAFAEKLKDEAFLKVCSSKRIPLAMMAAASVVNKHIIRSNNGALISSYFEGLTMTIPSVANCRDPFYHSIVGQKLVYVDWKKMLGVDVLCPSCKRSTLANDRTNFSKNRLLTPVFGLDGPPQWCMVMSMTCPCCAARFSANDSAILCRLPYYAAACYPVDSKYAGTNKNCHLGRSATDVFDLLLPTYGNGDLCSRLLYNVINRAYLERVASYYSFLSEKRNHVPSDTPNDTMNPPVPYLEKDGQYITYYPPPGDMIRDLCDEASNSSNNHWGLSDHDRHTREIQGVKCSLVFAQDHTHEVTKNYLQKKKLGIEGLWDVATETGEIACAVLVPSTTTSDFTHAATQLSRRESFNPKAVCSDAWPCKSVFLDALNNNGCHVVFFLV